MKFTVSTAKKCVEEKNGDLGKSVAGKKNPVVKSLKE